jgi:hypothetical protein
MVEETTELEARFLKAVRKEFPDAKLVKCHHMKNMIRVKAHPSFGRCKWVRGQSS